GVARCLRFRPRSGSTAARGAGAALAAAQAGGIGRRLWLRRARRRRPSARASMDRLPGPAGRAARADTYILRHHRAGLPRRAHPDRRRHHGGRSGRRGNALNSFDNSTASTAKNRFPPVSLIGVPTGVGAGPRAPSVGAEALRVAGLGEALAARGLSVHDRGNLSGPFNPWQPPSDGYRHLEQVVAWNTAVMNAVEAELRAGRMPIM